MASGYEPVESLTDYMEVRILSGVLPLWSIGEDGSLLSFRARFDSWEWHGERSVMVTYRDVTPMSADRNRTFPPLTSTPARGIV